MSRLLPWLLFGMALLLPACSRITPHDEVVQRDEAVQRAKKWLAGLGDEGFVYELKTVDPRRGFVGYKSFNHGERQTQRQADKLFIYYDGRRSLSIGFDEEIALDSSLEMLRKRFKYIALDRLPPPDLEVPGWEVRPLTPTSSFKEGVEIVGFADGRIRMRVKTNCFALYGRRADVEVPADAPLRDGTYFEIRQPFPLDLKVDLPLFAGPKE
jgi:hypothetical protein